MDFSHTVQMSFNCALQGGGLGGGAPAPKPNVVPPPSGAQDWAIVGDAKLTNAKDHKTRRATSNTWENVIHHSHIVPSVPNHAKPFTGQPEGTQSTTWTQKYGWASMVPIKFVFFGEVWPPLLKALSKPLGRRARLSASSSDCLGVCPS